MNKTVVLLLVLLLCFALPACGQEMEPVSLFGGMTYTSDTELGEGRKTVFVEVKDGETSVTFTLHTDEATLGDALLAQNLIAGEQGAYGLYVKTVNGVSADYNRDKTYWGFYIGGEIAMTGVDGEPIADGAHYELVRER